MKKYVKASRVDEFMKYHEDEKNWKDNQEGFLRMYDILNKYGSDDEDVDVLFNRASDIDQERMIELIKPENTYTTPGYAKALYRKAKSGNFTDLDYAQGVLDAFEALFKEGIIDKDDF